jgi:hypothetical protein
VYADAVESAFGSDIDYAMLVKVYGDDGGEREVRWVPHNANVGKPKEARYFD